MSNGERVFIGAIFGMLFMCWTGLVLEIGKSKAPDLHPTQETCEAELLRSESCKQVWVKE